MSYKLSGFTQRLVGASPLEAYSPQGFRPFINPEPPAPIFATPTKIPIGSSASEVLLKNKVPQLQKLFQKADGVPVHLKGGYTDRLLYRTTMALTLGGIIYCIVAIGMAAKPRRNK